MVADRLQSNQRPSRYAQGDQQEVEEGWLGKEVKDPLMYRRQSERRVIWVLVLRLEGDMEAWCCICLHLLGRSLKQISMCKAVEQRRLWQ